MEATPIPAAPEGPRVRFSPLTSHTVTAVGDYKVNMSMEDNAERPLYSKRRRNLMRFVVLLAIKHDRMTVPAEQFGGEQVKGSPG